MITKRMRSLVSATALVLTAGVAMANEIGFVEEFSLADDRSVPLKQLIVGTEDYYYYQCLHAQNEGQYDRVRELLAAWIQRYNYTPRVEEIRNRQALLEYKQNPQAALDLIKQRLGLRFDHQKQELKPETTYPTALDSALISRERLTTNALAKYTNLNGFEEPAFEFLVKQELTPEQRRDLLSRLTRPDYPGLPELVVADLRHERSGGFGSLRIHGLLLKDQLEACLGLMPELNQNDRFITTYLARLRPGADVDWERDPAEKRAYLERLVTFARGLPPHQNSLKAHVLYHRLAFDRTQDVYDKNLFLEYLRLPRQARYVNQDYLRRLAAERPADLNTDYRAATLLPPVGSDEPLVHDYLQRFLVDAPDGREFADYIEATYLSELLAETKIVNGIGDMEQWYALLPPAKHEALKERVDLEFLPSNRESWSADEPVTLTLAVKNVAQLVVKTYEINAANYYRQFGREVNTDLDLDGLVPNAEFTRTYDAPPLRRHVETLDFPALTRPGVYVIECIGNGRSSRALIRKGRLAYAVRTGAAGQVVTVFDERGERVRDARLWLAGHEYAPDEHGEILVPFSTAPGTRPMILTRGDLATLHMFAHAAEEYALRARFFVDLETLLEGQAARLLIRPELRLNGIPVDVTLLTNVVLTITATDRDGISSAQEVRPFALFNDRDATHEFQVPERLRRLRFELRGQVESLSQNKKLDLKAEDELTVNGIQMTERIADLFLCPSKDGYQLKLLGKSGEPWPGVPVNLELKHREFRDAVHVTTQTATNGVVLLGPLPDIEWLQAASAPVGTRTWALPQDGHSAHLQAVHAIAGTPIRVPFMDPVPAEPAAAVSLLEMRGEAPLSNCIAAVSFEPGFLVISGLPPGDYRLLLKRSGLAVPVRVTAGRRDDEVLIGRDRILELRDAAPVQIVSAALSADGKEVVLRLTNWSMATRVHLTADRFLASPGLFDALALGEYPELACARLARPASRYLSGRNIGDEYRYVFERRYAPKFPGNMLKKPSLLLNPWSLRKTEMGRQEVEAAEAWEAAAAEGAGEAKGFGKPQAPGAPGAPPRPPADASVDVGFLAEPSVALFNLRPNEQGEVHIPLEQLGRGTCVQTVAIDGIHAASRQIALAPSAESPRDLRQAKALDPDKRFTEQKRVTVLAPGQEFIVEDPATAKLELYDTLGKVHALYATLSANPTLAEFAFVLEWPALPIERKRELYSKYACHELNFFLFHKDPAFFREVIRPYLANKKDKTFLDHWLLEEDLTPWLDPWAFGRLNLVERILLGRRLKDQTAAVQRHVQDLFDLLPPDVERFNRLFDTALKGRALEAAPELALKLVTAKDKMRDEEEVLALAADEGRPQEAPAAAKEQADLNALREAQAKKETRQRAAAVPAAQRKAGEKLAADRARRGMVRRLYQRLEQTEEWAENNYYHVPIGQQVAALVKVNGFWRDYAAHTGDGPFLSPHLAEAAGNFTEMMFALAVLDLPFTAAEHKRAATERGWKLTAASPALVFHRELRETQPAELPPILVTRNYFAHDDRYRYEGNERLDKFVTEEFRTRRVYGAQVVLTNPTSARRKVNVLLQIPQGAVPVLNGFYTRSVACQLEPYTTTTLEYHFYFPSAGDFPLYPVQVAQDTAWVAGTAPFTFHVVDELTKLDTTSWPYISQHGSEADVLRYLETHNIDRLDLGLIAWRMRGAEFFRAVLALLRQRHVYHDTLWSYGVYHNDLAAIREYLPHTAFADQCGPWLESDLLAINPVARHAYQHKEYWPLVNPRVHQLGRRRVILNQAFHEQYHAFLELLAHKPGLNDDDRLVVTTYLLLQDRVDEALRFFEKINPERVGTRLQYDYLKAYLALCRRDLKAAAAVAEAHRDHPVDRWRNLFREVLAHVAEASGGRAGDVTDREDRTQTQTQLAQTEPALDLKIEGRKLVLTYQNLTACRLNYYVMDLELLFSRNPFVQDLAGQFAVVRPNASQTVDLPRDKQMVTLELPAEFRARNVMVEATAGAITRSQPYYPHALSLQLIENYGQLRVTHAEKGTPLPGVYVKVYARLQDGTVRFYKDGYTDLRGRFDYAALNTGEIMAVEKFSILILSDEHGALIREAAPPMM